MRLAHRLLAFLFLPAPLVACDPEAGGGGGKEVVEPRPSLTAMAAQVAGRTGNDLLLTVQGADLQGDVVYVTLSFLAAGGAPLPLADLDRDGVLDASGRAVFDESLARALEFDSRVTLQDVILPDTLLTSVVVSLEDVEGNKSAELSATVAAQAVIPFGGTCDGARVLDRCESPFSCRGDPPLCLDGLPPEITQFAFVAGDAGPRILLAGTEVDDDIATILLEFLDAAGNPTNVDLDNDESAESASFVVEVPASAARNGSFFQFVQSAPGLETASPGLAATPTDAAGHTGTRVTTTFGSAPVRAAGQPCDARGFDSCTSGSVCLLNSAASQTTCVSASTAIVQVCSSAPVLDPAEGSTTALFVTSGGSLFEPPAGCAGELSVGRTDGIAKLHLSAAASSLTITTARPGTNFDTIVYLVPGCGAAGAVALGCNDDVSRSSVSSTLVLQNVAPGDYTIVVDAFGLEGGTVDLGVSLE